MPAYSSGEEQQYGRHPTYEDQVTHPSSAPQSGGGPA